MDARSNLKNHPIGALRAEFGRSGIEPYRADQVAGWLYRRGVEELEAMTDLGAPLRAQLACAWKTRALDVADVAESLDGTHKLVLRAVDGALVEAVLIPEEGRRTLCVSTQVGCPLDCSFCATGVLGFTRNLETAEIVDQLCRARELLPAGESITNVVFMGMGEPLLNLPAVARAIALFTDPRAFGLAPRRITVSTAGVVPRIRPLLELGPINLAVSLHATTDVLRDELVPINRRYPLARLLGALRSERLVSPRRPVFFEYTLIGGVNDGREDARRLPALIRGIPCKVNAIPYNEHPGSPYRSPARAAVDEFTAELHRAGVRVTLRRNRGADIDAACGQLAGRPLEAADRRRGVRIKPARNPAEVKRAGE